MDRIHLEADEFAHIYNRGVDKRDVFMDDEDRARFFFYLGVLNDDKSEPTRASGGYVTFSANEQVVGAINNSFENQNPLVDLCGFVLMPNHFHLLVREKKTGSVPKYLQRLSTAYTMYFNTKYKRSGALFAGRYKSRIIEDEEYLVDVLHYIHNNPRKLTNFSTKSGQKFEEYFWSSLPAYLGARRLDFVCKKTVFEVADVSGDYKKLFDEYREDVLIRDEEAGKWLIDAPCQG